ncbi:MAG: HIT family protein [Anaerolineales bacterium]
MKYLRGEEDAPSTGVSATGPLRLTPDARPMSCIFCDKPAEDRDVENLIVHRGERVFVILNLYPYNNGHLMVVPYEHAPSLEQLDAPTLTELMLVTNQGLAALRMVYQPQAFNLGINIGQAAGAGIADHVHLHVVPRWAGDTNYMATIAGTRVIPEGLHETYWQVREAWPR